VCAGLLIASMCVLEGKTIWSRCGVLKRDESSPGDKDTSNFLISLCIYTYLYAKIVFVIIGLGFLLLRLTLSQQLMGIVKILMKTA
jgi:hypothetical protein